MRGTACARSPDDRAQYQGTSVARGSLMVCPALEKTVGEQLQLESFAAKERSNAAEERPSALAKKRLRPCFLPSGARAAEHALESWRWRSTPTKTRRAAMSSTGPSSSTCYKTAGPNIKPTIAQKRLPAVEQRRRGGFGWPVDARVACFLPYLLHQHCRECGLWTLES